MNYQPLIFHCVISHYHYFIIQDQLENLLSVCTNLIIDSQFVKEYNYLSLDGTAMDMKELLQLKLNEDVSNNSYLINMIILKLESSIKRLLIVTNQFHTLQISELITIQYHFKMILETCYYSYMMNR